MAGFSRVVKAARDRLQMTQMEFATALGVHWRTVQKWEGGERTPSGAALTAIRLLLESKERRVGR